MTRCERASERGRWRRNGATRPAALAADAATAAAERVRFVEEDDHAAVPDRELTKLAEEALHLQDAHTEEHVDERARIHEHIGLAGLAGHRLGHERLTGARRTPEQDASRHVAAVVLDGLWVLEVEDVFLHSGEHMILTPHVGEPRGHVARVVDVNAAPRHEPEDRGELAHAQQEDDHEVQDRRQAVENRGWRLEHALYRRGVVDEPEEYRHDGDQDQPFDGARQPEPGVVAHLVRDLIAAAEEPARQPVIPAPPLGEQVAQLAQHLQPEQQRQPAASARLHLQLLAGRVHET